MSEVGLPVGGYPTEIFKKGFDLKVLCNACNRVLRDPVQSYCGHRFCRECISAIIRWGYIVWKTQMCLMTGPPLSTSIHPKDLDLQSMCTPSPFPNIWTNRYLCNPPSPNTSTPPPPRRIKMQVGNIIYFLLIFKGISTKRRLKLSRGRIRGRGYGGILSTNNHNY